MGDGEDDLFEMTHVDDCGRADPRHRLGLNLKNPWALLVAAAAIGVLVGSGAPLKLVHRDAWRAGPGSGEAVEVPLTPAPKKPLSAEGAVHSGAGLSLDWCGGTAERKCKDKGGR